LLAGGPPCGAWGRDLSGRSTAGSTLVIHIAAYQHVKIICSATLDTNCDNAGVVFGYLDNENYWVYVWSKAQQKGLLYQVADGTWTLRRSVALADQMSDGSPYDLVLELGAGAVGGYETSFAAGQVGLWCSDASDNEFDDFKVQDIAGPFEIDGRWFCDTGDVRVDDSDNDRLETYGNYDANDGGGAESPAASGYIGSYGVTSRRRRCR
jgi:hypothetical protein